MDLRSAEFQVDKLLKYVKQLEEKQPVLYEKSKVRLRELSSNCMQVVTAISNILKEETLSSETNEFEGFRSSEISEFVVKMEDELNVLRKFISESGTENDETLSKYSNNDVDAKVIFHDYYSSMLNLKNVTTPYLDVNRYFSIFSDWFLTRFDLKKFPYFKFNISKLPIWFASTTIYFGNEIFNNNLDSVIHEYESWIDNVKSEKCYYAVPYPVNDISKSITRAHISLTSVVLWDIMMDTGFKSLCTESTNYLSSTYLYDICSENMPNVLDRYRDYKYDNSVLRECNIIK